MKAVMHFKIYATVSSIKTLLIFFKICMILYLEFVLNRKMI